MIGDKLFLYYRRILVLSVSLIFLFHLSANSERQTRPQSLNANKFPKLFIWGQFDSIFFLKNKVTFNKVQILLSHKKINILLFFLKVFYRFDVNFWFSTPYKLKFTIFYQSDNQNVSLRRH